jgi:hypothetical protein
VANWFDIFLCFFL